MRVAQRGEKRRLVELAAGNAEMALEHDRLVALRTRARRVEALEELREQLNLESLPVRIECFDISNLGESNTVASMVVFEDAVAKRADYRKFDDPPRRRAGRLRQHGRGGRPPVRAHGPGRPPTSSTPASRRRRTWS